jgi:hypothetical protein
LGMALFAGFVCPVAVLIAKRFIFGTPFGADDLVFLLIVTVPILPAFCCACVLKNGTVYAVLWAFPILAAGAFGAFSAEGLLNAGVLDLAASWFHRFPSMNTYLFLWSIAFGWLSVFCIAVLPVLYAASQSYRLFRREAQDNIFAIARSLLPLAIVAFLCGYLSKVPFALAYRSSIQIEAASHGAHRAIAKMQLDVAKLDAAHPLQFTPEDLARVSPPSDFARAWLPKSIIDVTPRTTNSLWLATHPGYSEYVTTVHFQSGWSCTVYGENYFNCQLAGSTYGNPVGPEGFFDPNLRRIKENAKEE